LGLQPQTLWLTASGGAAAVRRTQGFQGTRDACILV
jgi:hypothetical protein